MMTFKKDPIIQLATFVLIGFIISIIAFADNSSSPLQIEEQPQSTSFSSK
ncbi:MAG: hypothetical protein QNL62_07935 [Gammaproteobacteria bacterium]|nr:hypothetical protein [Gammaproteobacteria bacterium]